MINLEKSRADIIRKAQDLGIQYEAIYKGCGQCTFMAIIDALRWGGVELLSEEMENYLFPGICVLTAGVSMTGDGTCGAVASSAIVIGLALGAQRDICDENSLRATCATVRNSILERYYREYRSILCKDVQRKFFGKAWNLTDDVMTQEFLGITRGCTIMQTAMWTTEIILDELSKKGVKDDRNTGRQDSRNHGSRPRYRQGIRSEIR